MTTANAQQAEHWNNRDEVGHWITEQERHDRMLAPFAELIFGAAKLARGERVLDVGCGCGTTTLVAARAVDPAPVDGLDLSRAMLERAREIAAEQNVTNAAFHEGDAQVHPFPSGAYDAVISRFGVMFFDDPIAAFRNVHRATNTGGRLTFVCWQPLTENEWLLVPGAAVAQHVELPDLGAPGAPGMFAFADRERVHMLLREGGWRDVETTSRHTPLLVGGGGGVEQAVQFLRYGPLGRALLANADADAVAGSIEAVRAALAQHLTDDGVVLDAAVWLVEAVA